MRYYRYVTTFHVETVLCANFQDADFGFRPQPVGVVSTIRAPPASLKARTSASAFVSHERTVLSMHAYGSSLKNAPSKEHGPA